MLTLIGLIAGNLLLVILSFCLEDIFPILGRLRDKAEKFEKSSVTFNKYQNTMREIANYKGAGKKIVLIEHLYPLIMRYLANLKSTVIYGFLGYMIAGVYGLIQYIDGKEDFFGNNFANVPVLISLFYFSTLFIIGYEMRKILILNEI